MHMCGIACWGAIDREWGAQFVSNLRVDVRGILGVWRGLAMSSVCRVLLVSPDMFRSVGGCVRNCDVSVWVMPFWGRGAWGKETVLYPPILLVLCVLVQVSLLCVCSIRQTSTL